MKNGGETERRYVKGSASLQTVWGIALLLAGVGVFVRIPQVIPRIVSLDPYAALGPYIRFCFYLIGCCLIVGGGKKLITALKRHRAGEDTDRAHQG